MAEQSYPIVCDERGAGPGEQTCWGEIERLRAILGLISNHPGYDDYVRCGCLEGVREIARAALEARAESGAVEPRDDA